MVYNVLLGQTLNQSMFKLSASKMTPIRDSDGIVMCKDQTK